MSQPPLLRRIVAAPAAWIDNLIRVQEKRPFHAVVVLLFALFVGNGRLVLEYGLVGFAPHRALGNLVLYASFYWVCFFAYAAVVRAVVRQPWRETCNVVLVGLFLGIFPPVVDVFALGYGEARWGRNVAYEYVIRFPEDWSWLLYSPEGGMPLGESVAVWLTIFFTAFYVIMKTRSIARAAVATVLAYGVVCVIGALIPSMLMRVFETPETRRAAFLHFQPLVALAIYLLLNPRFARGLFARLLHPLPILLTALLGAAIGGPLDARAAGYALLVFFACVVTLAQNDWYDREDDARQGREPYLDLEDVRFLEITLFFFIATLIDADDLAVYPLIVFVVASVLYNHPVYRGKAHFPANLKLEAAGGLAAYAIGLIASAIPSADEVLAMERSGVSGNTFRYVVSGDAFPVVAGFFVFGGWSIIASLKEYKDYEADYAARVRTLYTIAKHRDWSLEGVHRWNVGAGAVSLALAFPLLALAEKVSVAHTPVGLLVAAGVAKLMLGPPSSKRFAGVLALVSLELGWAVAAIAMARA